MPGLAGTPKYKKYSALSSKLELKGLVKRARGIWKVLSMVFYLSNLFTYPIMFGIILNSYLSSMLWHKFHEDIILLTRIISL